MEEPIIAGQYKGTKGRDLERGQQDTSDMKWEREKQDEVSNRSIQQEETGNK